MTGLGWEGEDRGRGDGPFQGIKSLLLRYTPDPLQGFAGECIEGAGGVREVVDKLPIEVHEANCDSADFCWVHGNMVFQDDQPKVLNLLLLELTFLWLEKQPLLLEGS